MLNYCGCIDLAWFVCYSHNRNGIISFFKEIVNSFIELAIDILLKEIRTLHEEKCYIAEFQWTWVR